MPTLHFNKNGGRHADLPLHYGKVPLWLADRMSTLGAASFDKVIEKERQDSYKYGGRTVFGKAEAPINLQLQLFGKW